jgi:hypothetical protein
MTLSKSSRLDDTPALQDIAELMSAMLLSEVASLGV